MAPPIVSALLRPGRCFVRLGHRDDVHPQVPRLDLPKPVCLEEFDVLFRLTYAAGKPCGHGHHDHGQDRPPQPWWEAGADLTARQVAVMPASAAAGTTPVAKNSQVPTAPAAKPSIVLARIPVSSSA